MSIPPTGTEAQAIIANVRNVFATSRSSLFMGPIPPIHADLSGTVILGKMQFR
jgi:hypothetical protein